MFKTPTDATSAHHTHNTGIFYEYIFMTFNHKDIMLRSLDLKIGYDSECDDIVQDFFAPCILNCTEFSKSTNFFSMKTLLSIITILGRAPPTDFKMRIVVGRTFSVRDSESISNVLSNNRNASSRASSQQRFMEEMLIDKRMLIRVAAPREDEKSDNTLEEIGLFKDERGDVVLYDGIISRSFHTSQQKFETVDVFTSWNDKARLERKMNYFRTLWYNKAKRFDVYDFADASKNGSIKYSVEWAIHT